MSFQELILQANQEININEIEQWVKSIQNTAFEQYSYLENRTIQNIEIEIQETINNLSISREIKEKWIQTLKKYMLVEEIHEIKKGRHIRWIRKSSPKLTNGGIVLDIKFLDNGTHILCKNNLQKIMQIKLEENYIFQKLCAEEWMILYANSENNTTKL